MDSNSYEIEGRKILNYETGGVEIINFSFNISENYFRIFDYKTRVE